MSLYLPCSLSFLLTVRLSLSLSRFLFPRFISLSFSFFLFSFLFLRLSRLFHSIRCALLSFRSSFVLLLLDLPFRRCWLLPGKAVSLFASSSLYSLYRPEIRRARAGWMLSETHIVVVARLFSCSCCVHLSVWICMHACCIEVCRRRVLCADQEVRDVVA